MMLLNQDKARELMKAEGMDALVLAYTENVINFSGFLHVNSNLIKPRLYYVVFFADPSLEAAFLVPHQDIVDASRQTWIADVRPTAEYPYPGRPEVLTDKEASVADIITEKGLSAGVIGFENASLPYDVARRLMELLPRATFAPASPLIARLRATKSSEELRRIRLAMRATEAGADAIRRNIRPGITEAELAELAKQACVDAGADSVDFVIVGGGANGAVVHGKPTDYALTETDLVRFDLGASYGAYPGDFARTYAVGQQPPSVDARRYEAVRAAVEAGIEAVRPGATAGEVYDAMLAAGQAIDPELYREHAGHGLGLEVHEEPMIYSGSAFVLEPGMVVMIECGRYILGEGGYQLEDLVLVTDSGHEVITTLPRELVINR